jgi:hypothetical protein
MRTIVLIIVAFSIGCIFEVIVSKKDVIKNEVTQTCPKCPTHNLSCPNMPEVITTAFLNCQATMIRYIDEIDTSQNKIRLLTEDVFETRNQLDHCLNPRELD